jgi:hypothetical protein
MTDKIKCFVFGSNLAGRHGAGAALHAVNNHGAKYGQGFGYASEMRQLRDMSPPYLKAHSFGIPTKDENIQTLPLDRVRKYVEAFQLFAMASPHIDFKMTQIGCGLAGFKASDIAPMFVVHEVAKGAESNIWYDEAWKEYLPPTAKFWGTA